MLEYTIAAGSVAVIEDHGVFEEFASGDHGVEFRVADEVIVDAVLLVRPALARRV